MKITIFNQQKDLPLSKRGVRDLVLTVLEAEASKHTEVSIYFVTSKKISSIHQAFFHDPTPTDCISFPIDEEHLGEVFVCPKVAIAYAKKNHLLPHKETALYIIHGLLHCLGYDDLTPQVRRTMRKKEKACMALIESKKISIR